MPRQPPVDIIPIQIRAALTVQIAGIPHDLTREEAEKIARVVLAMAMPDETVHLTLREQRVMMRALLRSTRPASEGPQQTTPSQGAAPAPTFTLGLTPRTSPEHANWQTPFSGLPNQPTRH
jgi:hypothetical protein